MITFVPSNIFERIWYSEFILPVKHSILTSVASAIIKAPFAAYCHAFCGTLYGQLDIPWFPMDDIPPLLAPRLPRDPIIQSTAAALYQRALLLLDEIQLVFPFTFPAL